MLVKNAQKIIFVEFVARRTTVFVRKGINNYPNTAVNLNHEKSNKTVLRIENIKNSNYCTDGTVLFDTGSQRSFVTESVRKKLKQWFFKSFERTITRLKKTILYKIKIKGNKGLYIFIEAVLCPKICSPITNQKYNFAKNNYDHLRNIKLLKHSEGDSTSIDLLIGNDFFYSFINGNISKGQKSEPTAIENYLGGFILSGAFIDKNTNKESSINLSSTHVLRIKLKIILSMIIKKENVFIKIS